MCNVPDQLSLLSAGVAGAVGVGRFPDELKTRKSRVMESLRACQQNMKGIAWSESWGGQNLVFFLVRMIPQNGDVFSDTVSALFEVLGLNQGSCHGQVLISDELWLLIGLVERIATHTMAPSTTTSC